MCPSLLIIILFVLLALSRVSASIISRLIVFVGETCSVSSLDTSLAISLFTSSRSPPQALFPAPLLALLLEFESGVADAFCEFSINFSYKTVLILLKVSSLCNC